MNNLEEITTLELEAELIARGAELPPVPVHIVYPEPTEEPSDFFEYDLSEARDYVRLIEISKGDFIIASTDGTLTGISFRLGLKRDAGGDVRRTWYLDQTNEIRRPFRHVFLKNNVQAGKKLRLQVGHEAIAEAVSQVISAEFKNKVSAIVASTTALLLANQEYTSSAFSLEDSARIIGSCLADQDGVVYVEQRNDGANWDVQSPFGYSAGALLGFSAEVVANGGRIRFVNGAVNQGTFRLYSRLRRV